MSVYETDWLRHDTSRSAGERRFQVLATSCAVLFAAYVAATVAGAPRDTLSFLFSVAVIPVPVAGWWAYARSPSALRHTVLLCAWAASFWFLGSLVWYGFFLGDGSRVPHSPGVWDIF